MTAQLSRERIEQYANDPRMCNVNEEIRTMARMLLSGMESKPVGEVVLGDYDDCGDYPDAKVVCIAAQGQADWNNFKNGTKLYAAPPATVMPEEMTSEHSQTDSLPNIDDSTLLKIISGEIKGNATVAANLARHLLKAMSVPKATKQTMRTGFPSLSDYECIVAADVWNVCRAAMLKAGPVTAATVPDGWKLVPVEPTDLMVNAMYDHPLSMRGALKSAIAAAPAAPEQEV